MSGAALARTVLQTLGFVSDPLDCKGDNGTLSSFSACSQKRLLTWDTSVSKQGVTQKPNSLDLSAAHTPKHLIHCLICLDGCVPSQHLDHGKRCYTGFG